MTKKEHKKEDHPHHAGKHSQHEKKEDVLSSTAKESSANMTGEEIKPEQAEETTLSANEIKEELDKARKQAREYLDHLQRLQAEFDNYRKREEKQRLLLKEKILEDVACDLLPVVDNFERAMIHANQSNITLESHVNGMELVLKQFLEMLAKMHINPMDDTLGKKFDPHFHEAMMSAPSKDHEEGHVAEVLQKGWMLLEKVIRPAMVVVSSGNKTGVENETASDTGQTQTENTESGNTDTN
ncbi:MAG: nucleotide exchange factor GrpE [Candidatus Aureabacteria bacterium]|nr:nucleotide exchange factor GrpE [Candidatus Auribacterota bacterium]